MIQLKTCDELLGLLEDGHAVRGPALLEHPRPRYYLYGSEEGGDVLAVIRPSWMWSLFEDGKIFAQLPLPGTGEDGVYWYLATEISGGEEE